MHRTWYLRAVALGATAALVLGACGGDDDDDAGDTTETTESASGDEADPAAFCDAARDLDTALFALENEDGDPAAATAALDAVDESAPEEIADAAGTMTETGRALLEAPPEGDGPPDIPPDAFFAASVEVGDYLAANCEFEDIQVTTENYKFTGLPEEAPAGTALVRVTNTGTEFHEVVMFRIADGEERPIEELLQLPEAELEGLATPVNTATFAPPGSGAMTTVELEPGRHVAICFIPVGATPEALSSGQLDESAAPHFAHGMVAEFQVS